MRFGILLLLLISISSAYSQIKEVPLQDNPFLYKTQLDLSTKKTEIQGIETREGSSAVCVHAGSSIAEKIDTAGFKSGITSISQNPKFGTANIDKYYLNYTANTGLIFQNDTVIVKLCDSLGNNCKDLSFLYLIERNPIKTVLTGIVTTEGTKTNITLPVSQLPGPVFSIKIISDNSDPAGTASLEAPDQFIFKSQKGGLNKNYTVLACDQYCVCDTFIVPVKVKADTLSLPFMDDFSYAGPYPDSKRWIDDNVYINNQFANLPPSVGVASFDGLNSAGKPYKTGQGRSDYLTSRQLDLGKYNATDNVWLSFFIEPKGLFKALKAIDSFRVEFKNKNGNWDLIEGMNYTGNGQYNPNTFTFRAYNITDLNYLYKGFQFRFINNSDNNGMLDEWHLDYVILNAGVVPDGSFQDVAFTQTPKDLLKTYSAMPIWQFSGFEDKELTADNINLNISIDINNHFTQTVNVDPSSIRIYDQTTGNDILNNQTLLELPPNVPEDQRNLSPGNHHFDSFKAKPSFLNLDKNFAHTLITEYNIQQSSEANLESVKTNNKVIQQTVLGNYYALDDGTAESNIYLVKSGTQAAVKFHANVNDSLRAIQFHFPHVLYDDSGQLMNIQVWIKNLDSLAFHTDYFLNPVYTDMVYDSLQGFSTYVLRDENYVHPKAIFIPAGDFYVGWQQANDNDPGIPIGFDKNTPEAASSCFANVSSGWESFESLGLNGALMVRAVMGNSVPNQTKVEEVAISKVSIFPNPAAHNIHILVRDNSFNVSTIEITNMLGISLTNTTFKADLNIDELADGLYLIKLTDKASSKQIIQKLIIHH